MTRLYDGLYDAQKQLDSAATDKKALILISDGGDNASTQNLAQILKKAEFH